MADKKLSVTASQINNSVLNTGSIDYTYDFYAVENTGVDLTANQTKEYDLSSWLPNDDNSYLVQIGARAMNRTDGNFNLQLKTSLMGNTTIWLCYGSARYATSSGGEMANVITVPVGADKKVTIVNFSSTTTKLNRVFCLGYIKIKK